MTPKSEPLLERLAAADPARAMHPNTSDRDELWARIAASAPATRPRKPRRRRWSRRTAALALAAALAVTTGALAATKVIHFGTPAKPTGEFSNPHRGAGAVLPHSVRLLSVRTPDPAGGPPWGMRVLSTTRGVGCVQVGRVVEGKLVAIGRDHAFGDDGRFHALPLATLSSAPLGCTTLDAHGRIFLNVRVDFMPASGVRSCMPPGFVHGGPPPEPICNPASQRTLQYGLLGPDARSVTYSAGGTVHAQPTAGPEGAYLIVTPAKQQHRSDAVIGGQLPFGGPITAIDYRDGTRCNIPPRGAPYPKAACRLRGYVPPKLNATHRELATPVHVRIRRSHNPRRRAVIEVSFVARVAVSSARSAYTVSWSGSNERQTIHLIMTQGDVSAGQLIRKRFAVTHPGVFRGEVRFVTTSRPHPGPLPGLHSGTLVGRWTARVR